jgi:hypothetical protein
VDDDDEDTFIDDSRAEAGLPGSRKGKGKGAFLPHTPPVLHSMLTTPNSVQAQASSDEW